MKRLSLYLELFKTSMSLLIAVSAIFGFILQSNRIGMPLLLTSAGILVLALGSAGLNNYQDRELDRLFSRTRSRALPAGKISSNRALGLSAALIIIGIGLLFMIHFRLILPILGIIAVILYNGIYTPLKSRTVLAILPGALCGMIPPLIGWTAAGGDPFSREIISVMVLFGLWQLPHFWLILLNHNREYECSIIPNMLRQFTLSQLERITFIWIVNFAVTGVLISFLYWEDFHAGKWMFAGLAFILIGSAGYPIFNQRSRKYFPLLFQALNGSVFLVMLAVIVDRLLLSA